MAPMARNVRTNGSPNCRRVAPMTGSARNRVLVLFVFDPRQLKATQTLPAFGWRNSGNYCDDFAQR